MTKDELYLKVVDHYLITKVNWKNWDSVVEKAKTLNYLIQTAKRIYNPGTDEGYVVYPGVLLGHDNTVHIALFNLDADSSNELGDALLLEKDDVYSIHRPQFKSLFPFQWYDYTMDISNAPAPIKNLFKTAKALGTIKSLKEG